MKCQEYSLYNYFLYTKQITNYCLSRGEICEGNFIPPANVASSGLIVKQKW